MPGSPVQGTWGAALIGQLFNIMLTGVEFGQIWLYCWNYWHKDNNAFKVFVVCLIVIDMMSTITGAYAMYRFLVLNDDYHFWVFALQTIFNAIPGFAVQLYYTRRVYLVGERIIFPAILVPIILTGTFLEIFIAVKTAAAKKVISELHLWIWFPCVWMGATVVADILITVMMSWALYRKRTGFSRTDSMITVLMVYTINSGFLVSAMGTAMLISFAVSPFKLYYEAFFVVLSKCYMNSFLALLNTRNYVRDRSNANKAFNSFDLSSIRIESPSEAYWHKSRQPGITVTVHRSAILDLAQ